MKIIRKGILSGRNGCQNLKGCRIQGASGVKELKGWGQQRDSRTLPCKDSVKLLFRTTQNIEYLGNNQFGCLLKSAITNVRVQYEVNKCDEFCTEGKQL